MQPLPPAQLRSENRRRIFGLLREKENRAERIRQSNPEGGLLEFIRYFWHVLEPVDPFVEGWPLEALCAHLEAISRGDTVTIAGTERPFNRFLCNIPPGFMKSLCTNVFFPAWEWGPMNLPHLRYVSFSYASELTERDNAKFRDLVCSPAYKELWGHVFQVIGDPKAGKVRVTNNKTGFKFATSLLGVGTGERGHRVLCLPGTEKILTDMGWLPIGTVVEQRLPVRVAGLDHASGRIIWQAIEAYERNPGNTIVEVACERGALRCTGDHPVYVEGRGYARADSLRAGDRLVSTQGYLDVPELPDAHQTQAEPTPQILQPGLPDRRREGVHTQVEQPAMHSVWGLGVSAAGPSQAHARAPVLQSHVSRHLEPGGQQLILRWRESYAILRGLWEGARTQARRRLACEVLFPGMRVSSQVATGELCSPPARPALLRAVWQPVQAALSRLTLLFDGVQGCGALAADAGHGQWPLRAWQGSQQVPAWVVKAPQGGDPNPRWQSLPTMWQIARARSQSARPPHRLRQGQSGPRQPHNALPLLPRADARQQEIACGLEAEVVCSVAVVGREDVVYNVRVAPCHNYFASGYLVHNCDDIHRVKGTQETAEARLATTTWVREAMQNRLNDLRRDAIIVIMQRTHEQDASGAIMTHLADEYVHLILPMAYEANRHFTHYKGWNDGEDPRTRDGELAWPERYPPRELQSYKRNDYLWAGQYQQTPIPRGGGIFKDHWWQPYNVPVGGHYEFDDESVISIIASLDTAFKEKEENDYTALTVWAVYDHPKTKQRRVMIIDAWRKRLPLHGQYVPRLPEEEQVAGDDAKKNNKRELTYLKRAAPKWGLCEWLTYTCSKRKVRRLIIEDSARGHDTANELQRLFMNDSWTVVLEPVKGGDKWDRAQAVTDIFTDDMVFAPGTWVDGGDGGEQTWMWRDWVQEVILELCSFPRGTHDDYVDSVVQALRYLRRIGLAIRRSERLLLEREMSLYKKPSLPLYPA